MSEILKIEANERKISGTGNSRSVRKNNQVPGIIYGEKKEPILVSIDTKLLGKQIRKPGFFSNQIDLSINGTSHRVLPKDLQLHPVKESIVHVDFLRVGANTKVTVSVPVRFINENLCGGLKQGGVINIVRHEIEVKSVVDKIPSEIEVNLDGLEIGDSIHISSVKLNEGVSPVISDRDFTIATIAPPTVAVVEEEKSTEETDQDEKSDEKDGTKSAESKDSSNENKE